MTSWYKRVDLSVSGVGDDQFSMSLHSVAGGGYPYVVYQVRSNKLVSTCAIEKLQQLHSTRK